MAACHLGAPDAAAAVAAGGTNGFSAPQPPPPLPFVLIQGPPGTGKTHTVKVRGVQLGGRVGGRVEAGAGRWLGWRLAWTGQQAVCGASTWRKVGKLRGWERRPALAWPNPSRTLPCLVVPCSACTRVTQGVLNVWHRVAFQGYYDGLMAAVLGSSGGSGSRSGPWAPAPQPAQAQQQQLASSSSNVLDVSEPGVAAGRVGGEEGARPVHEWAPRHPA